METGAGLTILSANAGYLLDYDGSLTGYVRYPQRALIGDEEAEQRALDRLVEVIVSERPDVVSLLEVDQGSIRTATDGQVERIVTACRERGLEYSPVVTAKYDDDGLLMSLPVLDKLSNAVLVADDYETEAHYLSAGTKRLVKELRLAEGLSLFVVHLAMRQSTRAEQLREIGELVDRRESAIVGGDFNIYGGFDELAPLTEDRGMELHVPGETVPKRPLDSIVTDTRTLDLFVTTPDVVVGRCDVIDVQVSDHRPVVLEIDGWGDEGRVGA